MKIAKRNGAGGQRSQPRAGSQHFKQRTNLKSSNQNIVLGSSSILQHQQQNRANYSNQDINMVEMSGVLNSNLSQINGTSIIHQSQHVSNSVMKHMGGSNENAPQIKIVNQHRYSNQSSMINNYNLLEQPSQDKKSKASQKLEVVSSKRALEKLCISSNYSNQLSNLSQQQNVQQVNLISQRPSLFGNAILQQNLMSADTSVDGLESNPPIQSFNIAPKQPRQQTAKYAQGNPAKALRHKIKVEAVNSETILIQQQQQQSTNISNSRPPSKRPQSSAPIPHPRMSGQQISRIINNQSEQQQQLQQQQLQQMRGISKEKVFNQSGTFIHQHQSSQNLSSTSNNELIQVIGVTQRNNDINLTPNPSQQKQQFFDRRKVNQSRQGGLTIQYNSSQNSSQKPPHSVSTPHNYPSAGYLEQTQFSAIKKQEGIQMLPSTNKHHKNTKREYFARRMSSMDRPILIITFQGVIGDFFKQQAFTSSKDQDQTLLQNLQVRIGTVQGLRFLSRNFQIVIVNNQQNTVLQTTKEITEKIQLFLTQNDIQVDAIYQFSSRDQISQEQICEDYSQIFIDFNLNSMKKIQEKVLFINSIDMDNMGQIEQVQFDKQGYFLFDYSTQTPTPLVKGLPITLKFNQMREHQEKHITTVKSMPITILVPNPRGQYNFQPQQISFISIVKSIMIISILSQSRNKNIAVDKDLLFNLKEWEIKLNGTHITLFLSEQKEQQDQCEIQETNPDECDSTCTSSQATDNQIRAHKQMKSFHQPLSSQQADFQNLIGKQQRSSSCHSEENQFQSKAQDNVIFQKNIQLNDLFYQSINWQKYIEISQRNRNESSNLLGIKAIQTDLFYRYINDQIKLQNLCNEQKESRINQIKTIKQQPLKIPSLSPNLQSTAQKVFSDIYEILKDQRSNGNPLSNMMNRNLRVFDNIKQELKVSTSRELNNWEKKLVEQLSCTQNKAFRLQDFQGNQISNNILILGLDDPSKYFKTLYQAYEKYQLTMPSYNEAAKHETEIDVDFNIYKKMSLMKWLNVKTNGGTSGGSVQSSGSTAYTSIRQNSGQQNQHQNYHRVSNSVKRQRESSATSLNGKRPNSVSSGCGAGNKPSGRSFAETSATVISNIGYLAAEI